MKKSSLFYVVLIVVCSSFLFAQQTRQRSAVQQKPAEQQSQSGGKVIGIIFSDFNYVIQKPVAPIAPSTTWKTTSGQNSFNLTRAAIGYEHSYNKDVSGKILFDAANNSMLEANMKIDNLVTMQGITFGLIQTNGVRATEKIWGYRSLASTMLNRKAYVHEYDLGLELNGKFDAQGTIYYNVMVGNGNGAILDNDKLKKYYFNFGYWLNKSNLLEIYSDFENIGGGKSTITFKGLYGLLSETYFLGFEGFYRINRKFAGNGDVTPIGGSIFSWFEIQKGMRVVLRVDGQDDDLKKTNATVTSPSYRELYFNIGFDYAPVSDVRLIPNFVYVKELNKGTSRNIPDAIEFRLTASVHFPAMK